MPAGLLHIALAVTNPDVLMFLHWFADTDKRGRLAVLGDFMSNCVADAVVI
jgi:hypothetical protein